MSRLSGKKETECSIQSAICDYLALSNLFFWRQNNIAVYDPIGKRFRALPKYAMRGLPDIQIIYKGKTIFLEVKRKGTYQTPEQKLFEQRCVENKVSYFVVRSVEEAIERMTKLLES